MKSATAMGINEELRLSELRSRTLIDSIRDYAIFMLDATGRVVTWSPGAQGMKQYTVDEIVGKHFSIFYTAEAVERRHPEHELEIAASTGRFEEEGWRLRKDGSRFWANVVISAIRDQRGDLVGFAKVTRDLTERRNTQAREQAARVAAEEANRTKDEFLAMLGHELRNPLSPILAATQLMRMRGKNGPELEVIERQVGHLARLVDDLLDISRITRGKIELRKKRLELASAAMRGVEMASPLLEQRHQQVDFAVPAEGLLVEGDPDRLAQVFSNLLSNAAKYSESGTTIHVTAGRTETSVELRVCDHGRGIAPEMLDRIFDSFVQQSQALDRAKGGLGLGLTIVRSLVQLHGGTVEARSEGLGHGSEFIVKLPVAPGVEDFERAPTCEIPRLTAPSQAPSCGKKRLLIVDDNRDAAETTAAVLVKLGYEVRVAYDGPNALEIAHRFKPNICLLDIGLPVMDGYDLARRLREDKDLPEGLRLIAVTGYGQDADRKRSMDAGFNAHVVKPVNLDVLTNVVRD